MDYCIFFTENHIEYQAGLNTEEISKIEEIYNIVFPTDFREILEQALPIKEGFYNWRDFSDVNVKKIKQVIEKPLKDFYDEATEVYWNDDWGEEPDDALVFEKEVRRRLLNAPKLIPIYGHRYIPALECSGNPVFSVHGVDVICYGETIDDYFNIEFGGRRQDLMDFSRIKPVSFWSEVM